MDLKGKDYITGTHLKRKGIMKNNKVRLELGGLKISADNFVKGVNSFFDLIDEISKEFIGKKKIIWNVTVESGSNYIIAEPELLNGDYEKVCEIVNTINNGIDIIENKEYRPKHFSDNALKYVSKLASIVDEKEPDLYSVKIRINGKSQKITHKSVANIDKIMGIKYRDYGAIEGRLKMISERKGLRFVVYDDYYDNPIRCYFESEIINEVVNAFGKRVSVYGLILYKAKGVPYSIKVKKFRIFKDKKDLPTINDVLGIFED
ncbi:MAG: hypothetical protein ACTSQG_07285 [Promethearchaeota archaeon]